MGVGVLRKMTQDATKLLLACIIYARVYVCMHGLWDTGVRYSYPCLHAYIPTQHGHRRNDDHCPLLRVRVAVNEEASGFGGPYTPACEYE